MRVGLIARWPIGGIRTYLRDLLQSPRFDDVQFTVVAPRGPESELLLSEVTRTGIRWVLCPDDTGLSLYIATARVFLTNRFDIVHSHGFTAGVIATANGSTMARTHLLTGHEVIVPSMFAGRGGSVRKAALQFALRRTSTIHCVTNQAKDNLLEFEPALARRSNHVKVIKHGVNVAALTAAQFRDLRQEFGLSNDTVLVGFLGRFMEAKGFDLLIRAVAQLSVKRDSIPKFVVIAAGFGALIREYKDDIKAFGIDRYFRFIDFASAIGPLLKGLDVVVMPSRWEASGLLAMESLVVGTPLIAANCIGLGETLKDTPATLTDPGSAESLAATLESWFQQQVIHRQMTTVFQSEAISRFDSDKSFASLHSLYFSMAGAQ